MLEQIKDDVTRGIAKDEMMFKGWHFLLIGILALPAEAPALTVQLFPALASPQPAATPVALWAIADAQGLAYQFSYRAVGGRWRLLQDFNSPANSGWTPMTEGDYELRVIALAPTSGEFATDIAPYSVTPRVSDASTISSTHHPLVALYSRPPCNGGWVWARFKPVNALYWSRTSARPCLATGINFYVAGMRPESDYLIQEERLTPEWSFERGAIHSFRAGVAELEIPPATAIYPPAPTTSWGEPLLLHSYLRGLEVSFATDLAGQLFWYYPDLGSVVLRPVAGGTMLVRRRQTHDGQLLREIDLAGNILRETNATYISAQLQARGQDPINSFHHEALRLPNGHTVVIASVERTLTDVLGSGEVGVYGEMILAFDQDFQLVWSWNAFDHLDIAREAILGEVCESEGPGCPPLFQNSTANDWLHANTLWYVPEDRSLLLSLRHQDWVIKIDYDDGEGSGEVLWRLGHDGDFTAIASDPWPWFSHQHDTRLYGDLLVVYDNGNTRVEGPDGIGGSSRGQVWRLDEQAMTAELVHNIDLGHYSAALGSAQMLRNGNFHFLSGFVDGPQAPESYSIEVTPEGSLAFTLQSDGAIYRAFRMNNLYHP